MVYAMSDIHGCYEKYMTLMEGLELKDDDMLYILGDIVDRGDGGIQVIMDVLKRKNVCCLRGNHEHDALMFLAEYAMPGGSGESDSLFAEFEPWLTDGGISTYNAFLALDDRDKRRVLYFLRQMPIHKEMIAGGKVFHLSHTIASKSRMIHPEKCKMHDYLWGEPDYEDIYFKDKIMVTGHTPTAFIDEAYRGRIWKGNNHIALDCGAVFGNPLGCICLDTMEEIYADEKNIMRIGMKDR